MTKLDDEIAAYDRMRSDLEANHRGEWALVREQKLQGTFKTFEEAGRLALKLFGRGPYLIRHIGAGPMPIPASLMYRLRDANG